jgi:putative ABC transport system permease protein
MATLVSDLKYAARVLRKSPGFSLVAIIALALGIGANTAIFSVVSAVLLQPLPYPEPERLVRAYRSYPTGRGSSVSIPKFLAWSRTQSLDAIAAHDFAGPGLNLESGDRPEQVRGIHASRDYFRVLGATMTLGRTFSGDEDRPGGPRVVVLTHGLWKTLFGADPGMVGRSIRLNDESFTVVGVLGERFQATPQADLYMPLQADPNTTNQGHFLNVVGRLTPGITIDRTRAEFRVLAEQFRRQHPHWMSRDETATVDPMQEFETSGTRPALLILSGAVGFVLLIACANVASLLLVRAAGRQKEIAIRAALGAGRGRIIRQLIAESLLLALLGAAVGLAVGIWGAQALLALAPETFPRLDVVAATPLLERVFDWRLLAFTGTVSIVTGVLFGLAPALHLARGSLSVALKEGGGRGDMGTGVSRVRGALVVAEVALALILLVGAALLIRTFASLSAVDPGFDPTRVLTLRTSLAGATYSTPEAVHRLTENVRRELSTLPEFEGAAIAAALPTEDGPDLTFVIDGRPLDPNMSFHGSEQWRAVSRDYFDVLRIRLVRGRFLNERDTPAGTPVVVINEAMARRYWPGAEAVGQRLTIGGGLGPDFQDVSREVVGVVADVRERGLRAAAPPVIYLPVGQVPQRTLRFASSLIAWSWIVRTRTDPGPVVRAIQNAFLKAGNLPTSRLRTMEDVVARSMGGRFNMVLLTIFGLIAVALAAIGVYGLMSFTVQQATRDIGVRIALGAARRDIISMVVGEGMRLAAAGVVLGLAGAFGTTRVLRRMLFGVQPTDPLAFAVVATMLGFIALLACYVPARRATHIDPLVALRSE